MGCRISSDYTRYNEELTQLFYYTYFLHLKLYLRYNMLETINI